MNKIKIKNKLKKLKEVVATTETSTFYILKPVSTSYKHWQDLQFLDRSRRIGHKQVDL